MSHKKLRPRKNSGKVKTCPKCGGRLVRHQYDKRYVVCEGFPGGKGSCGWYKE